MKVLFVGPSLYASTWDTSFCHRRGPASQGDLARAVLDGATMIGLVDGYFGWRGAVWHKEILFALSRGVRVLGAASMGALRAAECARFGMEPIGNIADRFISGDLDDDAAVALTHASAEDNYRPLTEPLVDVLYRVEGLTVAGLLSHEEGEQIRNAAGAMFFQDRTIAAMLEGALGAQRAREVHPHYRASKSLKQSDAEALLLALRLEHPRETTDRSWQLETPTFWRQTLEKLQPTEA
jgi:hypothetical protein